MKHWIFSVGLLFFIGGNVLAVIVDGGDGTQNTTAPSGGQGWDYVGRISAANGAPSSVTYLDNNWFVTAYHVKHFDNPTGVVLGASSYAIDSGSWTRVTNSTGSDADLVLFQVTGNVGLDGVTIASSPANGASVTMIGNGRNRATDMTHWYVDAGANPYTWTETNADWNASGYKWASGAIKRWGTNTKEGDAGEIDDGFGVTDMFFTDFDVNEAQGATYDSGGGVFVENNSEWELAGLILTVSEFSGQPSSTSVLGQRTYMGDLSTYSDQINNVIAVPEPASLVLVSAFTSLLLFWRRIFRW